ncbi:18339_t:CDS:1 [Funneliformis geosporum]|uniref:18339_t:CDS:1 n=1 Tax=Funneliformis geosporum TaxID=1117311 RepID=A0A9W4SX16_9GLOM|nr:18339_t:CDS:1 [Funneliformis geosporum]
MKRNFYVVVILLATISMINAQNPPFFESCNAIPPIPSDIRITTEPESVDDLLNLPPDSSIVIHVSGTAKEGDNLSQSMVSAVFVMEHNNDAAPPFHKRFCDILISDPKCPQFETNHNFELNFTIKAPQSILGTVLGISIGDETTQTAKYCAVTRSFQNN